MKDLSGLVFGRWTVLSFSHKVKKNSFWTCRCECGTIRTISRGPFVNGGSKSCGCWRDESASIRSGSHHMAGTKVYVTWKNIRSRCENPKNTSYKYYGARGIKVCERWQVFEVFYDDIGKNWSEGMSIERIDNDKNYEPNNCTWIPKENQGKNRRINVFVDSPWGRITQADAARKVGITPATFCRRMQRWPKEKWFTVPNPNYVHITNY